MHRNWDLEDCTVGQILSHLVSPFKVAGIVLLRLPTLRRKLPFHLIGEAGHHVAVGTETCHSISNIGTILFRSHPALIPVVEIVEIRCSEYICLSESVDEGVNGSKFLQIVPREIQIPSAGVPSVEIPNRSCNSSHDEENPVDPVFIEKGDDIVPHRRRGKLAGEPRAGQKSPRPIGMAEVQFLGIQGSMQIGFLWSCRLHRSNLSVETAIG